MTPLRLSPTLLVFSLALFVISCTRPENEQEVDLSELFDAYKVKGSFILYDKNKHQFTRYNKTRCSEQFTPASTFKIPNSLIALEEGIIKDDNSILKWDSVESMNPLWNKDLTLKEAFRVSCVPCYIKIANRIGRSRYKNYLKEYGYGNRSTQVQTDDPNLKIAFWLFGELKISQEEQIAFLRKLYDADLPASKRSINIVKEILVDDKTDNYILSGKLGRGTDQESNKTIGWYLGYVEKGKNVFFFATNFESSDPLETFNSARKDITLNILRKLKVIV